MYSPIWASTMFPSSQRHQKSKGLKVKHLVQIAMITLVLTWVIYQLNHSQRPANTSHDVAAANNHVGAVWDSRKEDLFGRKELKPDLQVMKQQQQEEEEEQEQEQEQEQEVDRDEPADEERDEGNAFNAGDDGTEKETVRDDLDSGEHAAEEDGDLQDEEEDQDAEVAENKQKATDPDDHDLDQQREDADLQQDVGMDLEDVKNEEERNNWEKSREESGDEDLEFNHGFRHGITTEQSGEKTETKTSDSVVNLVSEMDGDEKAKENEISYMEVLGEDTALRAKSTKDSESMAEKKWEEDSTATSEPEQGHSFELGKQPETETMNEESESMQAKDKLDQDFNESNHQTSKEVIDQKGSQAQEIAEVRTGGDGYQEQGNREPEKETEMEKVEDRSQERKEEEDQRSNEQKDGTDEKDKNIVSQQQADTLNLESVIADKEEEDKPEVQPQQGTKDEGAWHSQETKEEEKGVVDQGLEGEKWDHNSEEEKDDRSSDVNESSNTTGNSIGAEAKDSHENELKTSETNNKQGSGGTVWDQYLNQQYSCA